jgi:hypothetical protein
MRIAGRHGSTCVAEFQKALPNGEQPGRYELDEKPLLTFGAATALLGRYEDS